MEKVVWRAGNAQSWGSGRVSFDAAASTRRANVMLLNDGSKSPVVALMDLVVNQHEYRSRGVPGTEGMVPTGIQSRTSTS